LPIWGWSMALETAKAAGEAACIDIGFSHDDIGAGADSTQPQFR